MKNNTPWVYFLTPFFLCTCVLTTSRASDDAYIRQDGMHWTFGTCMIERTVALENGHFLLKRLFDKQTGRELIDQKNPSEEFAFTLANKTRICGTDGGWSLIGFQTNRLNQGEQQLDISLQRFPFIVTRTYLIYPESSITREWSTIKNIGDTSQTLGKLGCLSLTAHLGNPETVRFHWLTGGQNFPGSWSLVSESLPAPGENRSFSGRDPFPLVALRPEDRSKVCANECIQMKILVNEKTVSPSNETWLSCDETQIKSPFEWSGHLKKGDRLAFAFRQTPGGKTPPAIFSVFCDPVIILSDGKTHKFSKEFGKEQGLKTWRYQAFDNDGPRDLVWNEAFHSWHTTTNAYPVLRKNEKEWKGIRAGEFRMDKSEKIWAVWTASKDENIQTKGTFACMRAHLNEPTSGGSGAYAPWQAFFDCDTRSGLFIGWDFFGVFESSISVTPSQSVRISLNTESQNLTLAPGKSVETPRAFTGLFRNDLDNAGNECLNWQYRYLWNYTREPWFPAIRMLGSHWLKGGSWHTRGWLGGNPDQLSMYRKIFRTADLIRYVGADVYHRDWGWWDCAGDWNGPDFRTSGNYLRKHSIGQLIYAFLYTVNPDSTLIKTHPEWARKNGGFDMARPDVVQMMNSQLDTFYKKWGAFEWRTDGSWSPDKVPQDQGFRQVIRTFLDRHPDCAFQACNGGGKKFNYDYVHYASCISFSDGAVGPLRNYYASLLLPPDKTSDIPDRYNPDAFDKAIWRGLLCINFDMTGDTWNPVKLEGVRELIDIYHYLHKQGVVGRWVQVYRPVIVGDDPTMYFQRLSGDHLRGIIIPKRPAPGAVTIKPKGLLPDTRYTVSFQESTDSFERKGSELMVDGIVLNKMIPGELIYLNLPSHPGDKRDKEPPSAPPSAKKQTGENMGYPGIELTWDPGSDNNWVSYYEIFRNGAAVDKVAKGTFYFDHSAGADLAADYAVRTVDGAGNASAKTKAIGPQAVPSRVFDDTDKDLAYTGEWKREKDVFPAYAGTLAWSMRKDAVTELTVEGKAILWFTKLGPNCGKTGVSLDGGVPTIIDTYSADDIFGVCVYRKALTPGKHTFRITVLNEHGEHPCMDPREAAEARVYIDGVRVEQ